MADVSLWKTKSIPCQGGTRLDLVPVLRDATAPGSLIDSKNFQSSVEGGYQRIKGYAKYDTAEVTGSDRVLGCFVFNDGVVACRGTNIYFGTGSGWGSAINPSARTGAGQYRAAKYRWSEARITLVDGVNKPVRYNGTTATDLSNAPTGATCVWEHKNYLFFGKDGVLTQSEPGSDTAYTSGGGGATYNVGDSITGLRSWRGDLYIFCRNSILKLEGSSNSNFVLSPVTKDIGCPWPDTIQEVAGDIVFLAADGLRTISGTERVGDVNLANISNPINDYIEELISTYATDRICATVIDSETQYRLLASDSAEAIAAHQGLNACLIAPAGPQSGASWEFFKTLGIAGCTADHGITSTGSEVVITGGYDGFVYQQNSGDSFSGSNIPAFIQLPYLVFDDPALRKTIYRLRLYVSVEDSAVAELTTQVSLDDGDFTVLQPSSVDMTSNIPDDVAIYGFTGGLGGGSLYGTAVYGQGASSNYKASLIGAGFNISLKVSSDDILPQYTIKTFIIEYSIEARQ